MEKNRIDSLSNADNGLNIQELLLLFASKWYWFVLSVSITLLVAVLYLLSATPIYTRTASVMLKMEDTSGSSSLISDIQDFGGFGASTNVNNEILALKSPIIMRKVVEQLRLDERYTMRSGLRDIDLYKESPIIVAFQSQKCKTCSFSIKLLKNKNVELSGMKVDKDEIDRPIKGVLGKSIKTPAGNIVISASALYSDKFEGKTIRYAKSTVRDVAKSYADRLKTDLGIEKGTIIELVLSDMSPSRATDVLNGIIQAYNESHPSNKMPPNKIFITYLAAI